MSNIRATINSRLTEALTFAIFATCAMACDIDDHEFDVVQNAEFDAEASEAEVGAKGTSDSQIPVAESDCDDYEGRAWGLCNAYCEAMDCELANDGDPDTHPNASASACEKIADGFDQASDGALLPCEVPRCPCLAYDGFVSVIESLEPVGGCDDTGHGVALRHHPYWAIGAFEEAGDVGLCGWYDNVNGYGLEYAYITVDEALVCMDALRLAFEESGACSG